MIGEPASRKSQDVRSQFGRYRTHLDQRVDGHRLVR